MNFTSDYISLCKNEKVQGLREFLSEGDYCVNIDSEHWFEELITDVEWKRTENRIWLPTSGQLDQHIIERLDDGSDYTFIYTNFSKEAGHDNAIVYEGGEVKEQVIGETNPLIAKIKLLISLLEG